MGVLPKTGMNCNLLSFHVLSLAKRKPTTNRTVCRTDSCIDVDGEGLAVRKTCWVVGTCAIASV